MRKKLIMTAVMFVVSFIIALLAKYCDVAPIGPCGTSIGLSSVNGYIHQRVGVNEVWYRISEAAGYVSILCVVFFAVKGFLQLVKRRSLLAVDRSILLMGAVYLTLALLYVVFEIFPVNFRPVLENGSSFPEPSFPSSHTILSCTVFLTCAEFLKKNVGGNKECSFIVSVMYIMAALSVTARFLSGVHWFTDIASGVSISFSLVSLYSALLIVM